MVIIEATKALCELTIHGIGNIEDVYNSAKELLGKNKFIVKYAALKIINKIAYNNPILVSKCLAELEALVTHVNKSVASLAISVLLKICKEQEIENLLSKITAFLPDIGDEFRVDSIRAVKLLAKRCPKSCKILVAFLKKCLRMFSNPDFKKEIIDSAVFIIQIVPENRNEILAVIAELIEDCAYENLISKGLDILANEIPLADKGDIYIPFICNRLILENEIVQASAVTALAKLAQKGKKYKETIQNILLKYLVSIGLFI